MIGVLGRLTPGLSAVIAELFQDVILPWKISARTVASSFRLVTPDRLYEIVIGPRKTGKYSTVLPLKFGTSAAGIGRVRAGEVGDAGGQVGAALARAAAAVVDRHAGLDRLEGRDGRLLVDGLERRSAPVERAAEGGALLLDEDALLVAEPLLAGVDEELDEEHAARDRAVATAAAPTVATRCLRPSGISGTPYRFYMFLGRDEQPRQPVSVQTVVCQYSLPARMVLAGKRTVDKCGPEG